MCWYQISTCYRSRPNFENRIQYQDEKNGIGTSLDYRVINSCRVVAERLDGPHAALINHRLQFTTCVTSHREAFAASTDYCYY